ncbi:MAG: DUF2750 domain-containing protein [Alphaproteobacteria bacterium]|jgi:hypothetical protein|nr:DUF2750 domain-containing protein [Alphaproteobacteria bacterium]MBP9878076.1 DUF2750 domain-containing protein [Alphaproteobacteria bacterium]
MDIKVENSPVDQFFKDVISSKKVYVLADGEHLVLVPSNEYAYDSSDIEDIDPEALDDLDADDLEEANDEADEGEIPFRVLPVWSQSYTKQAHLFAEDFEVKEIELEDLLALLSDFEEEQDLLIGPNWDEDSDCEELFPDEVMSKLGVFPAEDSE